MTVLTREKAENGFIRHRGARDFGSFVKHTVQGLNIYSPRLKIYSFEMLKIYGVFAFNIRFIRIINESSMSENIRSSH